MSAQFQPHRSVLFVPAINQRALEKTLTLNADAIIYDLEDSVAPEMKEKAREQLHAHLLAHPAAEFQHIIRINDCASDHLAEDISMALSHEISALLIPKLDDISILHNVCDVINAAKINKPVNLWAMIESAAGIKNVFEIAQFKGHGLINLSALLVGPNDIGKETGVKLVNQRQYYVPWLMQIVLAAKTNQLMVLDGVFNNFKDIEAFKAECVQGMQMGFDGKTLIHPSQIAIANEAFSPSPEEIAYAQAIVEAFKDPANQSQGVISINGEMVERLHLNMAERLLARIGR